MSVKEVRTYSRDRVVADRKASGNRGPDVRAVKEELVKRTIQNRMFERQGTLESVIIQEGLDLLFRPFIEDLYREGNWRSGCEGG